MTHAVCMPHSVGAERSVTADLVNFNKMNVETG